MQRLTTLALAAILGVVGIVAVGAATPARAALDLDAPRRVLDTRLGIGVEPGRVGSSTPLVLQLDGVATGPDAVVMFNLVAVDADRDGFVTAWPCDADRPETAVINFTAGRAVANMMVLEHPAEGICFAASSPVHLVADLTAATTSGEVRGIAPLRLLDTRESQPFVAGREYPVQVGGVGGVPANAAGAALNVVVVRPSQVGRVVVKPCGSASDAATINYQPGEVVPHLTFAELNGGRVCIVANADVDVVVDAFAWMAAGSPIAMGVPARLMDTRTGRGGTLGVLADGDVARLRVAGESGVPNSAVGATVNIAVVDAPHRGHVVVWPCDRDRPTASSINMWPGMRRSNQATLRLSQSGELCLGARVDGGGGFHLVIDAVGHIVGDVDRDPPPATTLPPVDTRFETLPVGADLPSGAECASRVKPTTEIRPENATPNSTRGSRANANNRTDWDGFDRVDGDFAGTTDEIIQWAACKWGIDEDVARAQIVVESWWRHSTIGDNGESWGLGQVRTTAHPSAFEFSINAISSSAYNLDYTYASWRACYEGVYTWLNTVERNGFYAAGDAWGCVGVWFSGRWYVNTDAYLNEAGHGVRWHLQNRTWETENFRF